MSETLRLGRLLEEAATAVDRADWARALRLADAIAALDPTNEDAAAIRTLARLRATRSSAVRAGSRRQVTVLFADMVGSTALAGVLDPEDFREVLVAFHQACSDVVNSFDGHVAHVIGDGLLVYFGFPRAHEDDPVRAVLAGLAMTERIPQLIIPVRSSADGPVIPAIRVGIHTGLVVIADMDTGDHVQPHDISGETPNLASRLHAAAEPNAVVMSEETHARVAKVVRARRLPDLPVRGVDRPLPLYEALGEIVDDTDETTDRRDSPLIGRAEESARIAQVWDDLLSSPSRRGLALVGDPGIGKSRLLTYAKEHVHLGDGHYRTLHCSPYHSATPLYPVVAALQREARREWAGMSITERIGLDDPLDRYLLNLVLDQLEPDAPAPELGPEALRERTFAVLRTAFRRLAEDAPLLLAVEDVHWADPSTLELLSSLLTDPTCARILLMVTSRTTEPVAAIGGMEAVSLGPLPPPACTELVAELAADALDSATRELIVEHGDGVPLYLGELTRMFTHAAHRGTPPAIDSIPTTLHDLLVARIDGFPGEQRLLQVVATVGQPVRQTLLQSIVPVDPGDLEDQLRTLVTAGLLEVVDSDGEQFHQFRHALQREAAYQLQMLSTRREVHADVAQALLDESVARQCAPPRELLAHHYLRADDPGAAAAQLFAAATQYAQVAAHAEAVLRFGQALEAARQAPPPWPGFELDAQAGLAASLLADRGYTSPDVADAYRRLRELSTDTGVPAGRHALAAVYGMWAYFHVRGENRTSSQLAEHLLAVSEQTAYPDDVLAAEAILGYQLLWSGRFREAADRLASAARRPPSAAGARFPHDTAVGATVNLATAQWALGRFAEARASMVAAQRRAEALEGPGAAFTRAYVHTFAAAHLHLAGDVAGCAESAESACDIASEHGFPSWYGAGMLMAMVAGASGEDGAELIPAIEMGLEAWRTVGAESNRTLFLLGLAQAHGTAGQAEEGLAALDEALEHAVRTEELYLLAPLHSLRAELAAPTDPITATDSMQVALIVARDQEAVAFELEALTRACRLWPDTEPGRTAATDLAKLVAYLDPDHRLDEPCLAAARAVLEKP